MINVTTKRSYLICPFNVFPIIGEANLYSQKLSINMAQFSWCSSLYSPNPIKIRFSFMLKHWMSVTVTSNVIRRHWPLPSSVVFFLNSPSVTRNSRCFLQFLLVSSSSIHLSYNSCKLFTSINEFEQFLFNMK